MVRHQPPPTSLTERLTLWALHGGGFILLLLFYAQQLTLMLGIVLLIVGFSQWSFWLVFFALLCLRGSFFLQAVYRVIGEREGLDD